jgi:type IV secretory pathway VirB2 component (pilin)
MKTQTIDFKSFVKNEWTKERFENMGIKLIPYGAGSLLFVPKSAFAQMQSASAENTFIELLKTAFEILDWGMVVVVIVSGLMWMFGHRTKGIELLLGGSIGYVIARHAVPIMEFLRGLGGGVQ